MLKASETAALKSYLNKLDRVKVDYPFSKTLAVYSVEGVAFAYLESGRKLLELSLRADPQLAKFLRNKYEEVAQGRKLDPRIWNTIVMSGQLNSDEIKALIDHSYQLASEQV
ncbi:MAG: MmcQ/YjbR family DNA-binding protein [Candidatus Saccharimonadales bacterium]